MNPGDYALGSSLSRAAARNVLEKRMSGRKRLTVVCSIPRPNGEGDLHFGEWIEGKDGAMIRFCNIPDGMTIQEAERLVSQPGWKPTHKPIEPTPKPPPVPEW